MPGSLRSAPGSSGDWSLPAEAEQAPWAGAVRGLGAVSPLAVTLTLLSPRTRHLELNATGLEGVKRGQVPKNSSRKTQQTQGEEGCSVGNFGTRSASHPGL